MRTDQYIGLNPWAKRFVTRTKSVIEMGIRIHKNGRTEPFCHERRFRRAIVERAGGIRGEYKSTVSPLHRYTLPDGRSFTEYVQETPWCGGPCYFIALKDADGKPVEKSLWTRERIANRTA